jgi:hypothetical protein
VIAGTQSINNATEYSGDDSQTDTISLQSLDFGTYKFYCEVTSTDEGGTTYTTKSDTVTVKITAASGLDCDETATLTVGETKNIAELLNVKPEGVQVTAKAATLSSKAKTYLSLSGDQTEITAKNKEAKNISITVTLTADNYTTVKKNVEITVQGKADPGMTFTKNPTSSPVTYGESYTLENLIGGIAFTDTNVSASTDKIEYYVDGTKRELTGTLELDAGTHTITATYEDPTRKGFVSGSFTVDPKPIDVSNWQWTLDSSNNSTKYDGNNKSYTLSSANTDFDKFDVTYKDENSKTTVAHTTPGEYTTVATLTSTSANYKASPATLEKTWTIEKGAAPDMSNGLGTFTVCYTAQTQTLTADQLVKDSRITWGGVTLTNATAADGNFDNVSIENNALRYTLNSALEDQVKNGDVNAVINLTFDSANYETVTSTVTLQITDKEDFSDKLSFNTKSYKPTATYTGAAQTYERAAAVKPLSSDKKYISYYYYADKDGAKGEKLDAMTNAGTYWVVAVYEDETRRGTAEVQFTITPATLTLSKATVASKEYGEGDEATVTGVTFTGVPKQAASLVIETDYTVSNATFRKTDVGSQTVDYTVTMINPNYTLKNETGTTTGTITKVEYEIRVVGDIPDQDYTGSAIKLDLKVEYRKKGSQDEWKTLSTTDYSVTCTDKNVTTEAKATIKATGKNCTFEEKTVTFSIVPAKLTADNIKTGTLKIASTSYTGLNNFSEKLISGTVVQGKTTIKGTWSWAKDQTLPTDADTYPDVKVTFTPDAKSYGENYTGFTTTATLTINKAVLTVKSVVVKSKTYDTTTNAEVESVTFINKEKAEVSLTEGTNYTVTAEFKKPDAAKSQSATCTVMLKEDGSNAKNYSFAKDAMTATVTTTAKIESKPVEISIDKVDPATYTGSALKPELTVTYQENGETITLDPTKDYTATYTNNTKAYIDTTFATDKAPTVTVKAKGSNYTFTNNEDSSDKKIRNSESKAFTIDKATPNDFKMTATETKPLKTTYTGNELADSLIKGTAAVKTETSNGKTTKTTTKTVTGSWHWSNPEETKKDVNETAYKFSVDFEPKDTDNYETVKNAAEVYVIIQQGTLTATVTFAGREYDPENYNATAPQVTFKTGKTDVTLDKGTYSVTAETLKKNDAGKQTVNCTVELTGTAANNWTLSKPKTSTCQITTKPVTVSFTVANGTYNAGKGVTPEVVVTDEDGKEIPEGNYTLTWKNNTKLYTDNTFQTKNPPTVTIKQKGSNYELTFQGGVTSKNFTIGKATPDLEKSSLKENSVTYTGSAPDCSKVITGTVKLATGSTVAGKWAWKEGSEPGADVGTYSCTAAFIPKDGDLYYTVTKDVTVNITPATLSTPTVTMPKSISSTATTTEIANAITVTVKFGKTQLVRDTDYTVTVPKQPTTNSKGAQVSYVITLTNTNYTFVQNKQNTATITGSKTVPVK